MKLKDLFEDLPGEKGFIQMWLREHGIGNYNINSDLTVDVNGNVDIEDEYLSKLPIIFNNVEGDFKIRHSDLISLFGSPRRVGKTFSCSNNPGLTSLHSAPSFVGRDFLCTGTNITTLQSTQVKHIGGGLYLPYTIKSHILGVMFIKGLRYIHIPGIPALVQVTTIINKHLKGNRNPHEVQEELIDAGLSEYAKL